MIQLIASLVLTRQGENPVTAVSLISTAFARYAKAQSIVGQIQLTQTAAGTTLVTKTQLQMEQPNKLYLLQVRGGKTPRQWLVTSDGKQFSFDRPDNVLGPKRFVENVHVQDTLRNVNLTNQDIYLATLQSLGDVANNIILDIAFARTEDLRNILDQWPTFRLHGKVKLGETMVYAIVGDYREGKSEPVTGAFELYINDKGDIVRYVLKQTMKYPQVSPEPISVVSTWDSNLVLNGKPNPALFAVVK